MNRNHQGRRLLSRPGSVRFATLALVAIGLTVSCGDDDAADTSTTTTVAAATTTTGADTTVPTSTETTIPDTTAPAPTTVPDTTVPDTTSPAQVDVRVYFLRGEQLAIAHADVTGPAVLRGALTELLAGPPSDLTGDDPDDLFSSIPVGTRLLDVALSDGTATVDLNAEFGSGGGTLSMTARVAQVVFTATQFDNVERVRFWIDGAPIEFLGGEGLVMDEPWTRADVAREFTGGVLIDSPVPGETVDSTFVVTGEADVYEGDFPIEIRRDGEVLSVVAPVSAGAWGNWDDFTVTITVDAAPGPIQLVAYDEGGCGTDPDCPPIIETVVPLVLR